MNKISLSLNNGVGLVVDDVDDDAIEVVEFNRVCINLLNVNEYRSNTIHIVFCCNDVASHARPIG